MAGIKKTYTPEFKKKVVRLVLEEGRQMKSVNQEYNLGEGSLRKWIREYSEECESNPELNNEKDLMAENLRLRKELAESKKENDFLKKAAAFFAKELD
ncbi:MULTISPECIES: transposase [Lachnospiraceae]|uniref:Transposase n=1 Tax=Candidatus Galacturonatibacter soehngenii TaxID=2307010 RepID=A0A7V7UAU9_9FIRM|nr:transposase [Candidatus Galacturonibacter soehngenii]KAB1436088.1 transposase [Candidatus Galacturonibacter soehngenii]